MRNLTVAITLCLLADLAHAGWQDGDIYSAHIAHTRRAMERRREKQKRQHPRSQTVTYTPLVTSWLSSCPQATTSSIGAAAVSSLGSIPLDDPSIHLDCEYPEADYDGNDRCQYSNNGQLVVSSVTATYCLEHVKNSPPTEPRDLKFTACPSYNSFGAAFGDGYITRNTGEVPLTQCQYQDTSKCVYYSSDGTLYAERSPGNACPDTITAAPSSQWLGSCP